MCVFVQLREGTAESHPRVPCGAHPVTSSPPLLSFVSRILCLEASTHWLHHFLCLGPVTLPGDPGEGLPAAHPVTLKEVWLIVCSACLGDARKSASWS